MAEQSTFQAKPVHLLAQEVEGAIGRLAMAEGEAMHFVVVVQNMGETRTVVFSNATAVQAIAMLVAGIQKVSENAEHIPDLKAARTKEPAQ